MNEQAQQPQHEGLWSVYFDGLCPLCAREIHHYQGQNGSEKFRFVDITEEGFQAGQEGVDPLAVHRVMHVKSPNGQLHLGVDAFIAIWENLPRYSWAARMARGKLVKPALKLGYSIFARVRPWLPRRSRGCEASPYCSTKEKS